MSATLHLAPIGADKTALTISALRQLTEANQVAFPRVWVLLATRRQEMHYRQRLIEADDSPSAFFNIEFFNFYTLNTHLLKIAGRPVRRLSAFMRHRILRQALSQMLAEANLNTFHRIADTRGFVTVMTELIDELKQNSVDAADFTLAARDAKDEEIATIYQRYQEALRQNDLADVEGEGWLALATLRQSPAIATNVDLLLVDGYDQFTPVQAAMLAQLAGSVKRVHITLTASPDAACALAAGRSTRARRALQLAFESSCVGLETVQASEPPAYRHEALHHLGQAVFRDAPGGSGDGAIQMIEMPDPSEEAREVLRAVKRLLLDGAPADGILIALRDWERYATYFDRGRDEYDVPLLLHYERSYSSAPVIGAFLGLMELAPRFRRRDLLDVLRSPYFDVGLDDTLIDALDRISLERGFMGGSAEDWLELLKLAQQHFSDDRHKRDDESWTAITVVQAATLSNSLSRLISAVTPPERADVSEYVGMIAALLGADPKEQPGEGGVTFSLDIIRRAWAHDRANPAIVARDVSALNGLQQILYDIMASEDVLRGMQAASGRLSWRQFWSDLKHALETSADDSINQPRRDQVLVTTAAEARGLPHDHVFILGLAEGVFPAETAEDPLYLDSERVQLQQRGIPLGTRAERIDDRGLFYELISLPRRTLTLSRPTYQTGRVWIESYLWRAVRAVFPDAPVQSRRVGAVIHSGEAANEAELMLAVAAGLGRADVGDADDALRARNWLRGQSELEKSWRRVEYNRAVEMRRISDAPFDRFSGVLSRRALLAEVAQLLGEDRIWSASQLKDYGLCGFRYFAKRLLKLEEIEEPEAGVDALQHGLLNHSILEATYKRIADLGLRIAEDNLPRALEIFREESSRTLETAPDDFNFRATTTWEGEMQVLINRLAALIKLDFSAKSPLNRFGHERAVHQVEREFYDVKLHIPAGSSPVRVRGYIDRIDLADGQYTVVDYKSGSTKINRSEMEIGRDFQMLIYIEALAQLLEADQNDNKVKGGMFWHLRDLQASGVLLTDNDDDVAALARAKAHIALNLKEGRAGRFPVHATKRETGKCSRYCEYSHFCRMQVTGRNKTLSLATTNE